MLAAAPPPAATLQADTVSNRSKSVSNYAPSPPTHKGTHGGLPGVRSDLNKMRSKMFVPQSASWKEARSKKPVAQKQKPAHTTAKFLHSPRPPHQQGKRGSGATVSPGLSSNAAQWESGSSASTASIVLDSKQRAGSRTTSLPYGAAHLPKLGRSIVGTPM
eukprot:TRINITY_DN64257_c1_g1_i1.p2 TRINITY_DN64257_c1_g1~~TRINITY_DN64257_c1_g1_i1.p2  ORF type:complete len:161 (+),score=14.86 TRINITY_DN64257_c1_g1_i1:589-1071(+)